jgi:uncharacterized protein (DUF2336 family)
MHAPSLIAELDTALGKASESQLLTILRRVTDLFIQGAEGYSQDHVAVFDDVISRLIEKTDRRTLIELSSKLAPVGNAPVDVIVRLASDDDIAIAGPVLKKSALLSDQALAEIAGTKSLKHLAVMAARARIAAPVTDVLIDRGNAEIALAVAANLDASISEICFVKLIGLAKGDKPLATAITSRPDVPPELEPFPKLALGT